MQKPGTLAKARLTGKALHPFPFESFYEPLMRSDRFCKKSCGLLPFAFFGDVGIVAPAKSENGEQVRLGIEIVSQPRPSVKISGGQLRERCRPELGMNAEKRGDLESVHVTDGAKASSPGVAVTVFGQQIPPELHLFF